MIPGAVTIRSGMPYTQLGIPIIHMAMTKNGVGKRTKGLGTTHKDLGKLFTQSFALTIGLGTVYTHLGKLAIGLGKLSF